MSLVNEAALLAVRRDRAAVGMLEFEDAKDIVTMGAERRSHVMTDEERRLTAYREAGKAVVAAHLPAADPVDKVTIVTRGRSTGMIRQTPDAYRIVLTRNQMMSKLSGLPGRSGGRGAGLRRGRADLWNGGMTWRRPWTALARDMVARWGLSPVIGPVVHTSNEEEVFLGNSITRTHDVSEEKARG